jgi:predicted component of type VI protein secretion system
VRVILEIQTGSLAGKRIELEQDGMMTVGRTDRADVVIPEDTLLSSIHFALELQGTTCRLVDHSRNGTSVNQRRVKESPLQNGDQIRAGDTVYVVQMHMEHNVPAPVDGTGISSSPRSAQFVVGSWSFRSVPDGWEPLEGIGMRRSAADAFPLNAIASQDQLQADKTLSQYVDSQKELLGQFLPQPRFETAAPVKVSGAEETAALVIRHKSDDGRPVAQRQIYARRGKLVGVLTFTTLENELVNVQPVFDSILSQSTLLPEKP